MIAYLLSTGLTVAGLCAAGVVLVRSGAVGGSVDVVWVAAGINLIAGWAAVVPLVLLRNLGQDFVPQAALGAMVTRMLVAAFALLAAMLAGPWPTFPLSIWTTLFYLVLLIVETIFVVRMVQRSQHRGEIQAS